MSEGPLPEVAQKPPARGVLRSNPDFRSYWAGYAVSQFGDRISELALPLIAIVILHASTAEVGLLTAAVWAPYMCALVVGAWVERQANKRAVQIAADLARAAILLSLPVAYWLGHLSLAQLFAVALLTGLGEVFFNTAASNVFAQLVEQPAYVDASSKLSAVRSTSSLTGPAVGGLLIQVLTAPVAVIVDALSFVVSAICIGRITSLRKAAMPGKEEGSVLRAAGEGVGFVFRHRYLRSSLSCVSTLNFFSFVGTSVVVLFASRELHLSAGLIGLSLGMGASGGLIAALLAPRIGRVFGTGPTILWGAAIYASSFAIIAVAFGPTIGRVAWLAGAEFASGVGVMLFDVNLNAIHVSVTPDDMRSRTAGAFSSINYGVRPLGAIMGGVLGGFIGIRATLLVAAIGGLASIVWLITSPIRSVHDMAELTTVDPLTGMSLPDPAEV